MCHSSSHHSPRNSHSSASSRTRCSQHTPHCRRTCTFLTCISLLAHYTAVAAVHHVTVDVCLTSIAHIVVTIFVAGPGSAMCSVGIGRTYEEHRQSGKKYEDCLSPLLRGRHLCALPRFLIQGNRK
ncbi:hypothetical protein KC19_8G049700 [Ceratodon purpureus]|uniref:Uncharacterized protein n=1 Tax=Ceratodon purpureus TaxID=3225 RepID=A0A8T0GZR6_CERPU|nr:hypothetical protein KC19_8G049700 [Ceratodon purpureus]